MTLLNTLLEISIYSIVLFGAIWLFRILLKKHLSAVMLYAVWFILIARLLMPVTITSGISFFTMPTSEQPTAYTEGVDLSDMFNNTAAPSGNAPYNMAHTTQQQELQKDQLKQNNLVQSDTISSTFGRIEITWEMVLVALWLAGIAVMLIQISISVLKLNKRIKSAKTVPAHWQRIAEQLQTELNIKQRVRLVMIEGFPSPALCGGIKPVIVLPCEMTGKSEESVRFALLHELTHIKRCDHIVSILLLLLRAVYWFNPVVWLMMKQMRVDIETACDSCLTKSMPALAKKRYAGTMLSMYAQQQIRYVLGMSMGQTKKTAERRLRGMFMRSRSSRKGKMIAILLTTVLLVTCFTTACQPTPQSEIVQSKNNDSIQHAVDSSNSIFSYTAPSSWTSALNDASKKMSILVDASVSVPSNHWGIYQLVPQKITREEVNTLIHTLLGDSEIYPLNQGHSVDEIEEGIIGIQAEMVQAQANGDTDKYDMLEQKLQELQTQWQASCKDNQNTKTITPDTLFSDFDTLSESEQMAYGLKVSDTGSIRANWLSDLGKSELARLNIQLSNGIMALNFVNNGTADDFPIRGAYSQSEAMYGLSVPLEEAKTTARKMVEDLGFDYLGIAAINVNEVYDPERMENNEYPKCYEFTFNRVLDEVPVAFAYWNGGLTEEDWDEYYEYAVSWTMREVIVRVDDSGVIGVEINVPMSDVNQLAHSIELMDFEEIIKIFEKQVFIEGCFSSLVDIYDIKSKSVSIDKIELNYMPTVWKDHPGQIIFVPVWDFYGSQVTVYDADSSDVSEMDTSVELVEGQLQRQQDLGEQSILTINAVDGSIMRRNAYMD